MEKAPVSVNGSETQVGLQPPHCSFSQACLHAAAAPDLANCRSQSEFLCGTCGHTGPDSAQKCRPWSILIRCRPQHHAGCALAVTEITQEQQRWHEHTDRLKDAPSAKKPVLPPGNHSRNQKDFSPLERQYSLDMNSDEMECKLTGVQKKTRKKPQNCERGATVQCRPR